MEHDGPPNQGTFAREPPLDTDNVPRRPTLAEKFEASRAAFAQWETARDRTDQQLYTAIGRLAEFAASVGNDQQTLINFAARQGVHATKASSLYSVITKLVVTSDRRKASKYATVLQFAARRGIEPTAEATASFIRAEGGIEACLASFRALPKVTPPAKRGGRPSQFGKAVGQLAGLPRVQIPEGLQLDAVSGDYFLVVGVRDADGAMRLLQQPVTDPRLVRKAVTAVAPKT